MRSSNEGYCSHSGYSDYASLKYGKEEPYRKFTKTPRIDFDDQLTRARHLKKKTDDNAYEVSFSYSIIRTGKTDVEKNSSFIVFKADKKCKDSPERIKHIAVAKIHRKYLKDHKIINLSIDNIIKRF